MPPTVARMVLSEVTTVTARGARRDSVTSRSITVSAVSPVAEKMTRTPALGRLGRSGETLPAASKTTTAS